jgi:hypothetical protein
VLFRSIISFERFVGFDTVVDRVSAQVQIRSDLIVSGIRYIVR